MTQAPATRRHPAIAAPIVGSSLLLLIGLGMAILIWQPGYAMVYSAAVVIAAIGLVALISVLAKGGHGGRRGGIWKAGRAAVVVGLIMALAVPAIVRQAELSGHGLRRQVSLLRAAATGGLVPKASVGDALLVQGSSTIVVVGVGDGTVRGAIPARQTAEIIPAGDHFVVEEDDRYQLYDAAGKPAWPAPIQAENVLARRAGVTALWQCEDDRCTITGYADSGRRAWQVPAPRGGGGLHHPEFGIGGPRGLATLPDRFAFRERSGYGWRVIDAATGKPLGTEVGHAAHLAAGATAVLRTGGQPGTCRLTIDSAARGGRTVRDIECRDPESSFIRGRMLVVPVGDAAAHLFPLDRDAGPVEVEAAERLLSRDYPALADDVGMAGLAGGHVEGWTWPRAGVVTDTPTWTREHPPVAEDSKLGRIAVRAGTAVVAGTPRDGSPHDQRRDSWIAVYDLTTGAETARVRVPAKQHYPIRPWEALPLRPGCAAAVADGLELLLLGTC